jgi:tetratricopeptide (TPR) repeat protein
MEERLKDRIRKNPQDPMNYYYLGKELMRRPLKDIDDVTVIEDIFKKAIKLGPHLWAPKILLGELLYKIGRFKEAEPYFKESLKYFPESQSVREYLVRCISKKSEPSGSHDISKRTSLYLFENNVREFIRIVLEANYGEEWWRRGVPAKVRATCAARREEALDEEKSSDLLLFADFYHYKQIMESNRTIFSDYVDIKEWGKELTSMEPIRNAIAHNRPLTNAPLRVKEYYLRFLKVMDKVRDNGKSVVEKA